ncbi:MAG: tetratricopeptide repeat protein [Betaproteobacteria bacterium]|nr:MAG: tetratricopeptide repeat protein [Betaproteobacteria bacterium]
MTSSQSLSERRNSPARKYAVARLFQPSAKPGLSSMTRVNVAIASGKRCSPISATPLLNSSSTRTSPDRLHTAHSACSATVRTRSSASRSAAMSVGASSIRPTTARPSAPRRRSSAPDFLRSASASVRESRPGSAAAGIAGTRHAMARTRSTSLFIAAFESFIGISSLAGWFTERPLNYNPLCGQMKGSSMRKLLISVFALLAGLAPVPTLHAAGMDSGPAANARPVDPDYESGKKAVEAGNWKTAVDSFERVASRDPNNADAQNYLGYAWRKSGNLDLAFKHYNEALRLDPKHRGAHEYIGEAYLIVNNLPKAEEHLARLDKLCFFPCEEYRDLKKAVEEYKTTKQGRDNPRQ